MIFTGDKVVKPDEILKEEKDVLLNAKKKIEMLMNAHRRLGIQKNKLINVSDLYVCNGYLYFYYVTKFHLFAKYNLKNSEVTVYANTKDDLLFLSKPYKYSMTSFLMSDEGGVYYQVDTEVLPQLKSCLNDGFLSDRIRNKEVLRQITEDSNPIILYYEFKKE